MTDLDRAMQDALRALLVHDRDGDQQFDDALAEFAGEAMDPVAQLADVDTFEEAGVLSGNGGLVLRMSDGTEYQLTLVRSR